MFPSVTSSVATSACHEASSSSRYSICALGFRCRPSTRTGTSSGLVTRLAGIHSSSRSICKSASACTSSATTRRLGSRSSTSPTISIRAIIRGTWRARTTAVSTTASGERFGGNGCSSFEGMSVRGLLAAVCLLAATRAAGVSVLRSQEGVELVRNGNHVDVVIAGRPFTTYYFDPVVAKPYFFPLRSAAGTIVTRGFPMTEAIVGEDRDEPHQRAMYFAHGDINGFDFWGEAVFSRWSNHPVSTFGRTVLRSLDEIRGDSHAGRLRATFDLVTPGGTIGREIQTYEFTGDDGSRTIDCEFT